MAIQVPDTQNEVSIFSEWFSAYFMKSPGLTASSLSGCNFGLFLYNFHLNQHLIGHSVLWRTAEWVRKINRFFYKILGHQRLKSQNTLFQKTKSRELTSASFRPGTSRLAISSCLVPSLVRPWGHLLRCRGVAEVMVESQLLRCFQLHWWCRWLPEHSPHSPLGNT